MIQWISGYIYCFDVWYDIHCKGGISDIKQWFPNRKFLHFHKIRPLNFEMTNNFYEVFYFLITFYGKKWPKPNISKLAIFFYKVIIRFWKNSEIQILSKTGHTPKCVQNLSLYFLFAIIWCNVFVRSVSCVCVSMRIQNTIETWSIGIRKIYKFWNVSIRIDWAVSRIKRNG